MILTNHSSFFEELGLTSFTTQQMDNKNMFDSTKKQIISLFIMVIGILSACIFSLFTYDYKIEKFAERCVDLDTTYVKDFESKTYLRIREKEDTGHRYFDLYNAFYSSSLCNGCREVVENDCVDNEGTHITFATQSVFRTTDNSRAKSSGFYYLHDGQYFTYFGEDTCSSNLVRYNCDSFVFISDEYAKTLLTKYGIYDEANLKSSFEKLVKEEQYCVLEINIDGIGTKKFCINNIITTSQRQGIHMSNLHGFFAVAYFREKYSADYHFAFEAEFKNGDYAAKTMLDTILSGGYSLDKYHFDFYQKQNGVFVSVASLNNEFLSIAKIREHDLFKTFLVIDEVMFSLLYFAIIVLIKNTSDDGDKKKILALYYSQIAISVLFLLTVSLFNLYHIWSIIPLVALFCLIITNDKIKLLLSNKKRNSNETENQRFYTINI